MSVPTQTAFPYPLASGYGNAVKGRPDTFPQDVGTAPGVLQLRGSTFVSSTPYSDANIVLWLDRIKALCAGAAAAPTCIRTTHSVRLAGSLAGIAEVLARDELPGERVSLVLPSLAQDLCRSPL